jgi:molecular chaperone GrpE (heat shock protein)
MSSNQYFPGIGLFNYFNSEEPSPEPERDPNVIYAEPIGENSEITALKRQIKSLEDKVRALTHENMNLKQRLKLENSIEKIYENIPSLQKIEETINNITQNVGR